MVYSVLVVFDTETVPPVAIGTYCRTDEDVVIYESPANGYSQAPIDCVKVVTVDVAV